MPTPEELEAAARRREIEELKRIWDENPNNPENRVPTDEEIQQAIQDQDMEEGNYLQAPYDFNQAMQIGQYFASQGMPPEIDPEAWNVREEERKKKIDQRAKSGQQGADIAKRKQTPRQQLDIPDFLQSVEMGEIYNRDKELYGEFDRLVEAARNSSGREKKALLQRAGRVREQIESGKDPMTIGEVPGAAWNLAQSYGKSVMDDPAAISEHFTDLAMDFRAAKTAASLSPIKHPVALGAAAAGGVVMRRGGKKLMKEILSKIRKPGGIWGDDAVELAGIGKLDIGDVDDFTSAKPLQMTGSGGGTRPRDLNLYGAAPGTFNEITDVTSALAQDIPRGGRRVKYNGEYYMIHKQKGVNKMTPYNKWYQKNVDPFKIPKDLEAKWRSQESGTQLDIFTGDQDEILYGTQGKTRKVPKTIRYESGTVDKFKAWYKNLFDLQGEERELMQKISIIAEKADLVPAKPKGKKFFEMDRSHIVPRSRGGSGLTFLEAWMANQKRGADWILDSDALQRAGIPRNWDELFNEWLAAKKSGGTIQTGLGPLDNINVDDYFAVEKGEPLSVVARRRKNIRNLVNRAAGGETEVGTLARDYKNMVLESKGYDKFDDPKLFNEQILDIEYAALNYDDLIELGEL